MKTRKIRLLCILLSVMTVFLICPVSAGETVVAPVDAPVEEPIEEPIEEPVVVPTVTVTPAPFYIGGVAVTEDMYDNITGDGILFGDGGYIRYDAETKTLTMNNASITSYTKKANKWGSSDVISGIRYDKGEIQTLRLLGDNLLTLHVADSTAPIYAIYGYSALSIEGSGALTIDADNPESYCYGIEGSMLTYNSGTLNIRIGDAAKGTTYGMRITDGIVVNGGMIDIEVGKAPLGNTSGMESMRDIVINGGDISIRVGEAKFSQTSIGAMAHPMDQLEVGITMNGGTLIAEGGWNNIMASYFKMGGGDDWYKYAVNSTACFHYGSDKPLDETQTVSASYLQIKPADAPWENTYSDISEEEWYLEDIAFVSDHGLMQGTGNDAFTPDMLTDRSMLVTVLWRMEGSPEPEESDLSFDDVKTDAWYYKPVLWAAETGLVLGTGGTDYAPTAAQTREQIALILQRYAVSKGLVTDTAEVDLTAYTYSSWAQPGVAWAVSFGLFDGLGVDVSDLTVTADRAEIAAYLRRFCEGIARNG